MHLESEDRREGTANHDGADHLHTHNKLRSPRWPPLSLRLTASRPQTFATCIALQPEVVRLRRATPTVSGSGSYSCAFRFAPHLTRSSIFQLEVRHGQSVCAVAIGRCIATTRVPERCLNGNGECAGRARWVRDGVLRAMGRSWTKTSSEERFDIDLCSGSMTNGGSEIARAYRDFRCT